MKKWRVGLLGAGYILKSHARALSAIEGVVLHAVCDTAVGRARAAAAEFSIPHVYDSLEKLCLSDCDAVHVLLPPALHLAAARDLLHAGKHVFLEKPMGLSADECESVADLATASNLSLGVNHNFLFAPQYQSIRYAARSGEIGAIDQLAINWLYSLPILQFGPFDNWMLKAPENLIYELGPHLAAFAIDLLGPVKVMSAIAANPINLPGNNRVFRRWTVIGESDRGGLTLTLSVAPGQTDRSLTLRGFGAVAHFDFERGIGWQETQSSDNPVFDNLNSARSIAGKVRRDSLKDFVRYLTRTLRKKPGGNPFEESIYNSISAFYLGIGNPIDERLSGHFGAEVIRLCEGIVSAADLDYTCPANNLAVPPSPSTRPRVLVVGGTGFIGRRLVDRLTNQGIGVRVLTRNLRSAQIDLSGLDVELMQGEHSDLATLDQALAGIDTVYHLAKATGQRWQDYRDNDIEPTRALAAASIRHGVKRFLYTGTIDSYSSADAHDTITGDTELDPTIRSRNLYARSKAACEELLRELHRSEGLPLVIFRPGVVIGPGSPPAHMGVGHFVSATRVEYWGKGDNAVPFVLVDDVAEALALALNAPGIDGQTFLLTDAPLLSAQDYVAAVEARAGGKVIAKRKPIWRYWVTGLMKEVAKHVIRHANRHFVSYHDWDCKAHRANYDATKTREMLKWNPAGTKEALIERGINASVDRFMR